MLYGEEAPKKIVRRHHIYSGIQDAGGAKDKVIGRLLDSLYTPLIRDAAREYFEAVHRADVAKKTKRKGEMLECQIDLLETRRNYVLTVMCSLDSGEGAPYDDVLKELNVIAGKDEDMKFSKPMLSEILYITQNTGITYEKHPRMYRMA